jgi:hypothetical protein
MGFQAAFGSGSKAYFSKNHQMPDSLLGEVVGGRHPGMTQERGKIGDVRDILTNFRDLIHTKWQVSGLD